MFKFANKMQAYGLFLILIVSAQTCIYATVDMQEGLTITQEFQTLADTYEDVADFDLFTPDELVHEEQVIKEQEANISLYAMVIGKLQLIGGTLSSPFFWLLYKFYKWRAQRA